MDTFQYILIGFGALLVLSNFIDFKSWIKDEGDEKKPPVPDFIPSPIPTPKADQIDFLCLMYKWDELKICCHKHGLHDACERLDSMFPLLSVASSQCKGVDNEPLKSKIELSNQVGPHSGLGG